MHDLLLVEWLHILSGLLLDVTRVVVWVKYCETKKVVLMRAPNEIMKIERVLKEEHFGVEWSRNGWLIAMDYFYARV